jgi:hypothetical protein
VIPSPSSHPGDACTPSTVVLSGNVVRTSFGSPSSQSIQPCAASAPAVQANERWIRANSGSSSGFSATSSAWGGGRSSVGTYLSVFPRTNSAWGRFATTSTVPTGSGPIAARSPSTHQASISRGSIDQHRFECMPVAMDVRQQADPHGAETSEFRRSPRW